jgi:adenosylcobinamide kinase / adenosylcobinamide-phosphate guanylyltransferase
MSPTAAIPTSPAESRTLAGVTLVLGGARSGKSRFAENLLAAHPGGRVYLATAEAGDAEMVERIRRHRERRGVGWATLEVPIELAPALETAALDGSAVLVDCLTLWLSNLMAAGRDVTNEADRLVATLVRLRGPAVLVSNEVGLGIVPDNALAREFRDHVGLLHQAVAKAADRVYFVAAGLPLLLKDGPKAAAEVEIHSNRGALPHR